jgi:hypothetical protein
MSDREWETWPAGPYLIETASEGPVIGSCGFAFNALDAAEVGYILTENHWGMGYATEALCAQVEAARVLRPIESARSRRGRRSSRSRTSIGIAPRPRSRTA